MPNVKSEPGPQLARGVRNTTRDSCGRWLYCLVGRSSCCLRDFWQIAIHVLTVAKLAVNRFMVVSVKDHLSVIGDQENIVSHCATMH
ncbi:MAG TPA: hypothetical protein PLN52_01525 [Opitutaceae bacterium]|nr:hypothetical protein [Opitutaceae bacterium]